MSHSCVEHPAALRVFTPPTECGVYQRFTVSPQTYQPPSSYHPDLRACALGVQAHRLLIRLASLRATFRSGISVIASSDAGCIVKVVSPGERFDTSAPASYPAVVLCPAVLSCSLSGLPSCSSMVFFACRQSNVAPLPHYVEIPAVQSQQQSPSVENANKKKVHMYAYTS